MYESKNESSRDFSARCDKKFHAHNSLLGEFYHYQYHQVLEYDDLIMVGIIGLIDAMNKYDSGKKNQFKTYAEFRIRGEIIDELRKQDWMSRSERNKQKKFKKAKRDLTEELGRNPSEDELVNVLPFKRKDVVRMEQYETGEMIKPYVEGETVLLGGLKNTEFESYELKKTLSTMIDDLPKVMRIIVVLKYFEDLNFSEISKVVNLSEGRVCQLHAEALDMMKGEMETIDILNVA